MERYDAREQELGEELMGQLERFLLLQIIDERWREHLFDMDYLREGIGLRGFVQIDPLVAYKNEAFTLFGDLINSIWADYTRLIFNVQVSARARTAAARLASPSVCGGRQLHAPRARLLLRRRRRDGRRRDRAPRPPSGRRRRAGVRRPTAAAARSSELAPVVEQRVVDAEHQVGRNDPCWCGRGRSSRSATARRAPWTTGSVGAWPPPLPPSRSRRDLPRSATS